MSSGDNGIELALPLSASQRTYLFQGLRGGSDIGKICIRVTLEGVLESARLQQAWAKLVHRHQCLRSSIRYGESSPPMQLVHNSVEWSWSSDQVSLAQPPVGGLRLRRIAPTLHRLEIHCHHILLDGWSVPILLRELLQAYQGDEFVPGPTYSDFRDWLVNQQDSGREYWREASKMWAASPQAQLGRATGTLKTCRRPVPEVTRLRAFASRSGVTLSTLLHGAWALTLAVWRGSDVVNFGRAVSGRQVSFSKVEELVGPLSGVLPFSASLDERLAVKPWLKGLQRSLVRMSAYEHTSLVEVHEWCGISPGTRLFDSVLLVQDFVKEMPSIEGLQVQEYSSDVSTAFPLNLIAQPEGADWGLTLLYEPLAVDEALAQKMLELTHRLLTEMVTAKRLGELMGAHLQKPRSQSSPKSLPSRSPRTPMELALQEIWIETLGRAVGVEDDFFELGGDSLQALALVDRARERVGLQLSLRLLLTHPTIAELAGVLDRGTSSAWESLVPLEPAGNQRPLFCIHAEGGHVMHLMPLARALPAALPVYGLQARGLDSDLEPLTSFSEMGELYAREIRTVQPSGPYRLLSHCAGISIAIAVAQKLLEQGESVELLALVDASRPPIPQPPPGTAQRVFRWLEMLWRFAKRVLRGEISQVLSEVHQLLRLRLLSSGHSESLSTRERIGDLITLESRRWSTQHYGGRITLLQSQNIGRSGRWTDAWYRFAPNGVTFRRLDTDHETILDQPHTLAAALGEFL